MSGEEIRAREEFGALGGCFVEGDPEQRRREKKTKRRALALSVSLQIVALAAVILLPLLGKAERISLAIATPIPPYSPYKPHAQQASQTQVPPTPSPCHFCAPTQISPTIVMRDPTITPGVSIDSAPGLEGVAGPSGPSLLIGIDPRHSTPPPPPPQATRRVSTHLEPAMLLRRIEPIYPHLAIQVRKEGKVELRAIVGTDGTIQSLQVVSGDAFFIQSAVDAVRQWRYRPTILNGQAVEVDTTITVTYTLAH